MHFGRFPRKTLLAATLLLAFSSANASFVEQIGTPALPLAVMGTYAADAQLKSGLKAVIPAGWQLFQHQSVDMPAALSWEPTDTWVSALNKFASKNDIAVLIDWDKKAVYFRSTSLALQEQEKRQMIAQAASTPLPSFARPAAKPVDQAAKPALAAAVTAPAAPLAVSRAAREVAGAAAVAVKPEAAPAVSAGLAKVPATLAAPAALATVTAVAVAAPAAPAVPVAPAVSGVAALASAVIPSPAPAPVPAPATAAPVSVAAEPKPATAAATTVAAAVPAASPAAGQAAVPAMKPALKPSATRPALRLAATTATVPTVAAPAALPVAPVPAPAPAVMPAVVPVSVAAATPAVPAAAPAAASSTPGAAAFNREPVSKVVASAGAKHGYTVSWEAPQVVFPGPVTLLGADMGEDMRLVLRALGGRRAALSMTVYRDSKVVVVREAPYGMADVSFTDMPFSGTLREPAPLKDTRTLFVAPPAVAVPASLAALPLVRPAAVATPARVPAATLVAAPVTAPAVTPVAARPAAPALAAAVPSPAAEPLRVTPEPARLATAVDTVKKLEPAKPAVAAELRTVTLRVAAGGSLRDAIEAQLEPGWSLKWDVAGAFEANTELKASGESLVAVLNQVLPRLKLSADIYKPSKLVVVREADPALDK
jgi:hypothetical protein